MKAASFPLLCGLGFLIRLALIAYGVHHDSTHALKYTDVDYRVFSDATRFLLHPSQYNQAAGPWAHWLPLGSPFARETYRYTPLLALLLTPNAVHPLWGKLLFSAADVGICVLLHSILQRQKAPRPILTVSLAWLFNPMPINIATRGSSEALLGLMVLACLYAALQRRWTLCALLLGLAAHFKIYPVVYAVSLVMHLAQGQLAAVFSLRTIKFGLIALGSFMLLNLSMYLIWGQPYLDEAWLYHAHRLDHRHNFASAFYPISLSSSSNPLTGFVPQLLISFGLGLVFAKDLPFTWFLQTATFVIFNKVCTSQYFLWYLWLLPLVLSRMSMSWRETIVLITSWIGGQAIWLKFGYDLEMLGQPVYFQLWLASLAFQILNIVIVGRLIDAYCRHRNMESEVKLQ